MKLTVLGAAVVVGGAIVYMSGGLQKAAASGQEGMGAGMIVLGLILGIVGVAQRD